MSEVTRLLAALQSGEAAASDALLAQVYSELRRLAAQKMARERAGQTLQPTALVHEALDRFDLAHPQKAELVKLRLFVGLPIDEAAALLELSPRTAKRHWAYAKALLLEAIERND